LLAKGQRHPLNLQRVKYCFREQAHSHIVRIVCMEELRRDIVKAGPLLNNKTRQQAGFVLLRFRNYE
jgi:hypothetical protein